MAKTDINVAVTGETSDGYHTFNELYDHRAVLLIALMVSNADIAWYSAQHSDGSMFDGMFIAGMNLPTGQITYHVNIEPWWDALERTLVERLPRAPEYDGHSPDDVIDRITQWVNV